MDVVRTPRLDLVATTIEHLDAELDAPARLGGLLGAVVPPSWPPGVYDHDAMRFFRARLLEGGRAASGWYNWYAILRATPDHLATLVAAAGYFGPPAEGVVEIGYSTAPEFRSRGYTVEVVEALTARALATPGVHQVIAEAHDDNVASGKVLIRAGFVRIGAGRDPGHHRYARGGAQPCGAP